MKKPISLLLSLVAVALVTGCDNPAASSSVLTPSSSESSSVSSDTSSGESISTSTPTSSSSSSSSSKPVVKVDILLTAEKTNIDVNEELAINSSVADVTLTTTEGAKIVNGVFSASKEGKYVVTGHKDGDFNDGTIEITVTFAKTEAKVRAALQAMKEGQNYTISSANLLGEGHVYRTKDYYFDTTINEGQALFDNIIPETKFEKVAHYIKFVNNELVIGNDVLYRAQSGDLNVATDLYDVDYLYYVDLDKLTFVGVNGVFESTNVELAYVFGDILSSEAIYYASSIKFSFDANYDLTVELAVDQYVINLTITDIGTTTAPAVEDALKKVTVSKTGMSEEVASSFMMTKGHIKTTIKEITDEKVKVLGTSEYNFDEKYLIEEKNVGGTIAHHFFQKDENGDAYYVGVGPDNKVVTEGYGEWESFTFPYATLDLSQFRLTSEHTYTYMGYSSNAVANNLAWASIGENVISYITAKEENGKIVSFTCETQDFLVDIGTGDDYVLALKKFVYEVEVLDYIEIKDPAPFEADADTVRIKAYLDELNGEDANYTMYMGDRINTSEYKQIKVTKTTILVQETKSGVTTYHGYHVLDDGIIEFTATNSNGEASATLVKDITLEEGQTFASLLGLNIAPETLMFDVDGNIVFKDGVMNAGTGLFNELKYNKYALDKSIVFKITSGHISDISYSYAEGENAIEFVMPYTGSFGTTSFTSTFEQNLLEVLKTIRSAPTPTTWEEESSAVYEKMVTLLGERVSYVPYVYDVNYSGKFDEGAFNPAGTMLTVKLTIGEFASDYRTAIVNACYDQNVGFVQNGTNKNSCYLLFDDGMKLTIGTTGTSFTVLYKAAK